MDRFDELVVFTAILDAGSLAAAARRLRRSSPAVTRSLAALEERVGLRLVQRTTRKLAPTEAGLRFANRARKLLADYGEATGTINENRDAPLQGLLRVTAPSLFGRRHVTPLVASFLDAHPGIRIELMLTNSNLHLIEEGFDVAVRLGPLANSGLVARRVGQVREVLLASSKYLARRGRPRTPTDLAKHDIVFNSPRPAPLTWRFRGSGRDRTVSVTPRLIVSDTEAMIVAIRMGLGIGRALSYQAADDIPSGTLMRLLREFEPPPRPIHLVVPTAQHMPSRVRAFLDHVARGLVLFAFFMSSNTQEHAPRGGGDDTVSVLVNTTFVLTMARYNTEMNRRLFTAAARLTDQERLMQRGAFWGSIHGTLCHLLWGDQIWMSRFDGWEKPSVAQRDSSNMVGDFDELREARTQTDAKISEWAARVDYNWLQQDQSWFSVSVGRELRTPRGVLIVHFFNHQTHHRGQAHAMITSAGEQIGDTDLFLIV